LGKSGHGRIEFDGNNGIIQSGNYVSTENATVVGRPAGGMKIDLTDGHIDAYNFKLTSNYVNFDSSADAKDWMFIGNENTYLKFGSGGKLNIRVTDFELTYHQGENLLVNTGPLEDVG
jgi:hypothetical protein